MPVTIEHEPELRQNSFDLIADELTKQYNIGYTSDKDDELNIQDWYILLNNNIDDYGKSSKVQQQRDSLIKTAALAIAALESTFRTDPVD